MESKKVFSIEKFIEDCKQENDSEEEIESYLVGWAWECDGLTKEEILEIGYRVRDSWFVEVDE